MVYLVKLDNAYKIGYSDNLINRLKSFQTTHVEVELIAYREGGITEERILQNKCSDYNIKGELFKIDSNVIILFNSYVFDNLYIEIDKLNKEIIKKDKELEKLKEYFKNKIVKEETVKEEPITKKVRQTMIKGRLTNYNIEYYDTFIKIGSLIYYDKINNTINNEYGREAKKYTTKAGIDMYYIDMGIALIVSEINDIINNQE